MLKELFPHVKKSELSSSAEQYLIFFLWRCFSFFLFDGIYSWKLIYFKWRLIREKRTICSLKCIFMSVCKVTWENASDINLPPATSLRHFLWTFSPAHGTPLLLPRNNWHTFTCVFWSPRFFSYCKFLKFVLMDYAMHYATLRNLLEASLLRFCYCIHRRCDLFFAIDPLNFFFSLWH